MGVLNVTPDSFTDGGRYELVDKAVARARFLMAAGATMVDVGAESTRPGAPPVSAKEQLRRALPVVESLAADMPITIDTTSAEVAAACLFAGAIAINDVACGASNALGEAAAQFNAGYILSHARSGQDAMGDFGAWPESGYADVTTEVLAELKIARERLVRCGVREAAIVFDPGLGFTKSYLQSARLLSEISRLGEDALVLVGASRKSFLTLATGAISPAERLPASLASALWARRHGAAMVRVHDVGETAQAFAMEQLLARGGPDV